MKTLLFRTTALLVSFAACSANADTESDNGRSPDTTGDGMVVEASAQTMLSLLEGRIETARDKFVQLAEAIPEERYDWRPMDDVRSFREVFIHIAADNWARPYSREHAVYPAPWLRRYKFWPPVARIDNVYGDRNLCCTCPPTGDCAIDS